MEGYAYREDEEEEEREREKRLKRYQEIEHLRGIVDKRYTSPGKREFWGTLPVDHALNADDLCLLCDHGSCCFGGTASLRGNKFHVTIYTD